MVIAAADGQALPALTWEHLQIILQDEAATPLQRVMAAHLVDGIRTQSRFLTLGGILREVAIITLAVTDQAGEEVHMSSTP